MKPFVKRHDFRARHYRNIAGRGLLLTTSARQLHLPANSR